MSKVPGLTTVEGRVNEFLVDADFKGVMPITIKAESGNATLAAGTAMAKITASGLYTAYDDDGTDDGRRTMVGLLAEPINAAVADGDQLASLVLYGIVDESKTTGVDANGKTDVGGRFYWL